MWIKCHNCAKTASSNAVHFPVFVDVNVATVQFKHPGMGVNCPQYRTVIATKSNYCTQAWIFFI